MFTATLIRHQRAQPSQLCVSPRISRPVCHAVAVQRTLIFENLIADPRVNRNISLEVLWHPLTQHGLTQRIQRFESDKCRKTLM